MKREPSVVTRLSSQACQPRSGNEGGTGHEAAVSLSTEGVISVVGKCLYKTPVPGMGVDNSTRHDKGDQWYDVGRLKARLFFLSQTWGMGI